MKTPLARLLVLAALVGSLAIPAAASAADGFHGERVIERRHVCKGNYCDTARVFEGPLYEVQPGTTNSDAYYCPREAEHLVGWVAIPDEASRSMGYSTYSLDDTNPFDLYEEGVSEFHVRTHNWGLSEVFRGKVLWICGNSFIVFPPLNESFFKKIAKIFAEPIERAISRLSPTTQEILNYLFEVLEGSISSDPSSARAGKRAISLENGANVLSVGFERRGRTLRPPALYLRTSPPDADCTARRLLVSVFESGAAARLKLSCRDLPDGARAWLSVGRPLKREFPLRDGTGSVDLRLDKVPGAIEPFVHLSTRPAGGACRPLRGRLRDEGRTLRLRLTGRCRDVPRGATGRLYVGGLLAAG